MEAIARIGVRIRRWVPAILREGMDRHDQEQVNQDTFHLRDSLALLDSLGHHMAANQRVHETYQSATYDGLHLLSCMRLMMEVRHRSKLPVVIERALDVACPAIANSIRKELAIAKGVPNASTLSRNQMFLDAALLCMQRDIFRARPHLYYIMADSSPQCSYNFFLSHMLTIAEEDILIVFQLAQQLSTTRCLRVRGDMESDECGVSEEEAIVVLKRRHELTASLELLMQWVTNLPQCLGSGATSLSTKVRLILHGFWMFSTHPRLRTMINDIDNVVAFTTDMGTELGLAEFCAPCIRSVMPPWLFPGQQGHVVLEIDEGVENLDAADDDMADPVQGNRTVFSRSLLNAGVLHIFHNLSWKIDDAMPSFARWLDGLKALVTLLHYSENREKFMEQCVRGTPFDTAKSPLKTGLPTTTDWRWGSIVIVVTKVLPLRSVLQCTFDVGKMMRGHAANEPDEEAEGSSRERVGRLNLKLIGATVSSGWWWAFTTMIETLHKIIADFQCWCESCPCHYDVKYIKGEDLDCFVRVQRAAGAIQIF